MPDDTSSSTSSKNSLLPGENKNKTLFKSDAPIPDYQEIIIKTFGTPEHIAIQIQRAADLRKQGFVVTLHPSK